MPKAAMHSFELSWAKSAPPLIDKCAIVPILACAYATMIGPLLDYAFGIGTLSGIQKAEPGEWNRIFWPAMATASVVLAARYHFRVSRLALPPHLICLLAYVALAGASVLWA